MPTHYRLRFQVLNAPAGRRDQDREDTTPIFKPDSPDGYSGLVQQMWHLSDAQPGATITAVDGDYVRIWTLLEVL